MTRAAAQGAYLPNVTGWKIEHRDEAGASTETYGVYDTTDDPRGVIAISCALDGLGLLSSATVQTVLPPEQDPRSYALRLTLFGTDAVGADMEEVAFEGIYDNFSVGESQNGSGVVYTLRFIGLHEKISRAYWYGRVSDFPPKIPDIAVNESINLLGIDPPDIGALIEPGTFGYDKVNKTVKVSEVMEKALEAFPDGTWGVDGERRMILGRPQDGGALVIPADRTLGLRPTSFEIPPYITESKSDAGLGYNSTGQFRPATKFTPHVAQDANPSNNDSVTTYQGPSYTAARYTPEPHYLIKVDADFYVPGFGTRHDNYYLEDNGSDGYGGEDFHDRVSGGGSTAAPIVLEDLPKQIDSIAKADTLYIIADPQAWFEGSSLFGDGASSYEPVQAAWPVELKINRIPQRFCSEVTGPSESWQVTIQATAWLSDLPTFDPDAVGKAGTPIYQTIGTKMIPGPPDPYTGDPTTVPYYMNQLNDIEGGSDVTCVHVENSSHRILTIYNDKQDVLIAGGQDQTSYKILFEVDPRWFRQDQRQALIDAGWSGRFYYHMVLSYTVTIWGLPIVTTYLYPGYQDPDHPDYPHAGRAQATFTLHKPLFSQRQPANADLSSDLIGYDYPFFAGPNYEGWVKGALIPPGKIEGEFYTPTGEPVSDDGERQGLKSIDQYVAGVEIALSREGCQTRFRTNILPYKRFNPYTYSRRYR